MKRGVAWKERRGTTEGHCTNKQVEEYVYLKLTLDQEERKNIEDEELTSYDNHDEYHHSIESILWELGKKKNFLRVRS